MRRKGARPLMWGPLFGVVATFALVYGLTRACLLLPMPAILALIAGSMAGLVSLPEDDRIATSARVREVLSILQIPVSKAAVSYMAWDLRAFERALAGEQKLDWWRLAMIGPEFRRLFAMLELRDLGLPSLARAACRIDLLLEQVRRSA